MDQPHVHVLLHGRRQNGEDLVIPLRYIRGNGLRDAARDAATARLGERATDAVPHDRWQVAAERYTSLDAFLQPHLDDARHGGCQSFETATIDSPRHRPHCKS